MNGQYAKSTTVSVEKSRAEIESTLTRYGALRFMVAMDYEDGKAAVQFESNGRHIKFMLTLPVRDDKEFTASHGGRRKRSEESAYKAWEQACRQKWRALLLAIKAKLEAVESGIAEFDDEFLAYIVLPGGQQLGSRIRPEIESIYNTGEVPRLMLAD